MDSTTALIILVIMAYPYLLVLRLLHLACKALKTYIRNNE